MHLLRKRCRDDDTGGEANYLYADTGMRYKPIPFVRFKAGINVIETMSGAGNDTDIHCCSAMD